MTLPNPPLAPDDIQPGQALQVDADGDGWEAFTPGSGGGQIVVYTHENASAEAGQLILADCNGVEPQPMALDGAPVQHSRDAANGSPAALDLTTVGTQTYLVGVIASTDAQTPYPTFNVELSGTNVTFAGPTGFVDDISDLMGGGGNAAIAVGTAPLQKPGPQTVVCTNSSGTSTGTVALAFAIDTNQPPNPDFVAFGEDASADFGPVEQIGSSAGKVIITVHVFSPAGAVTISDNNNLDWIPLGPTLTINGEFTTQNWYAVVDVDRLPLEDLTVTLSAAGCIGPIIQWAADAAPNYVAVIELPAEADNGDSMMVFNVDGNGNSIWVDPGSAVFVGATAQLSHVNLNNEGTGVSTTSDGNESWAAYNIFQPF